MALAASQSNIETPIDFGQRYSVVEKLGCGANGQIFKAIDSSTNEFVAVKVLPRCYDARDREQLKRELINHRTLQPHNNIIGFKEVIKVQYCHSPRVGVVIEFAADLDLHKRLKSRRTWPAKEPLARFYFQQLIIGIQHLHNAGICHRDIKLGNSLVQCIDAVPILKICDFGCSKSARDSAPKSLKGSLSYIAPEVFSQAQYNGKASDVWSAGVLLYALLCGTYPFGQRQSRDIHARDAWSLERLNRGVFTFPPRIHVSANAKDLIKKMLVVNPENRISLQRIKRHPFFKEGLAEEIVRGWPEGPGSPVLPWSVQPVEEIEGIVDEVGRGE